ncbi:hypothetical protein Y032_0009g568 [Ancylostoma ceylanicum]|uniref:Uncharacterized protein n=1 Tax=Ancylostoma ceylanicum TaxID=53326 RepID=A0A016VKA7_9BILA|nr:hypothetical protein Y032_0009g568 [Ancylostoma ceylanicum]
MLMISLNKCVLITAVSVNRYQRSQGGWCAKMKHRVHPFCTFHTSRGVILDSSTLRSPNYVAELDHWVEACC